MNWQINSFSWYLIIKSSTWLAARNTNTSSMTKEEKVHLFTKHCFRLSFWNTSIGKQDTKHRSEIVYYSSTVISSIIYKHFTDKTDALLLNDCGKPECTQHASIIHLMYTAYGSNYMQCIFFFIIFSWFSCCIVLFSRWLCILLSSDAMSASGRMCALY